MQSQKDESNVCKQFEKEWKSKDTQEEVSGGSYNCLCIMPCAFWLPF